MSRRRLLAVPLVLTAVAAIAAGLARGHRSPSRTVTTPTGATRAITASTRRAANRPTGGSPSAAARPTGGATVPTRTTARTPAPSGRPPAAAVRVAEATVRLTDPRRTVGGVPRSFRCEFLYPRGIAGRVPLVVFGHGYAVTPAPYRALLDAWVRAGYLVAAPVFPLENAGAPGGPDERDMPHQPGDVSLVISSLAHPAGMTLRGLAARTDLTRIAVTGQSDGGDTALAAAYDPSVRDRRIAAAMILSGAEDPFTRSFAMPAGGPPLLAVQGTADTINPPADTASFFDAAARPKYLLRLLGLGHLPPYTEPIPARTEVERVTIAFLDRYLKRRPAALRRYAAAGTAGPASVLTAAP